MSAAVGDDAQYSRLVLGLASYQAQCGLADRNLTSHQTISRQHVVLQGTALYCVAECVESEVVADALQAVELHTQALSSWLEQQLLSLHHSNGAPLINLFGNHQQFQQHQPLPASFGQGAIFNFQVLQSDGSPVSYLTVEREAAAAGIDLRSGCVCNPGACYDALGLHADEVQGLAGVKEGCGDDVELVTVMRPAATGDSASSKTVGSLLSKGAPGSDEQQQFAATQIPLGSVRASLGWASTFEDVFMFVEFLKGYIT